MGIISAMKIPLSYYSNYNLPFATECKVQFPELPKTKLMNLVARPTRNDTTLVPLNPFNR
jgi:hypothetical protein